MVDLHIHTNMSDGQYSPTETVRMAAALGVTIMAITDHDTLSGIEEGTHAAQESGLCLIPGIEISVKGQSSIHILGYCIDIHNDYLGSTCETFRLLRRRRELRILDYLRTFGFELSAEQVERCAQNGVVGRPHFAQAMVEAGYVNSIKEAFLSYLSTPEFQKIERPKPTSSEGIEAIRKAGGIAVLAHPAQLNLDDAAFEALARSLKDEGLKGIECRYSTHSKARTAYYIGIAKKYGLLITGGSDFHGEAIKPDIKMGTGINNSLCFTDNEIYEKLRKAAKG